MSVISRNGSWSGDSRGESPDNRTYSCYHGNDREKCPICNFWKKVQDFVEANPEAKTGVPTGMDYVKIFTQKGCEENLLIPSGSSIGQKITAKDPYGDGTISGVVLSVIPETKTLIRLPKEWEEEFEASGANGDEYIFEEEK